MKKKETKIPMEEWGIHQQNCTSGVGGCKYGNDDCPVVLGLKLEAEYRIALDKYNSGEKPSMSRFIDEDTITMGYGELSTLGDFEFPLPNTLVKTINGTTSWKELTSKPKPQAKKISDLKQGDEIYDIEGYRIRRHKYLCVHPTGGGKYHILIDECDEPIRLYETHLQTKLDKNINSRIDAYMKIADLMEKKAKVLRQDIIKKNLT